MNGTAATLQRPSPTSDRAPQRRTVLRQRLLALRWRFLESIRTLAIAQFALGAALLARGLVRRKRSRYAALDDFCTVGRVVRIGSFARLARLLARADFDRLCGPSGRPHARRDNGLLREVLADPRARDHLEWVANQRGLRKPTLGGDLLILKAPDLLTGEMGVILLKYNPSFVRFLCVYDITRVLESYQLVLEPSWIGYEDPVYHLFIDRERHVVVEAHQRADFEYVQSLAANLLPVSTGSSYWVDEDTFRPIEGLKKKYIAIMVANWTPLKRHDVLLRAVVRLGSRKDRVALVGFPIAGYGRERIDSMVRRFGLGDRVDLFEWLAPQELNILLNQSHANILLSHKEGGNKAVFEGLFAGVPCIVAEDHMGIRREDVNEATGIRVKDLDLAEALLHMREVGSKRDTREWALNHASSSQSTSLVESALREAASRDGRPWTAGIVRKVNRPFARYKYATDWQRMMPHYRQLAASLREEVRTSADLAQNWDPAELDPLGLKGDS